jgi:hypothetical protein
MWTDGIDATLIESFAYERRRAFGSHVTAEKHHKRSLDAVLLRTQVHLNFKEVS